MILGVILGVSALYFSRPAILSVVHDYGIMTVMVSAIVLLITLEIAVFVALKRDAVAFKDGLLTGAAVSLVILFCTARWYFR
jgi:hypothetical protein